MNAQQVMAMSPLIITAATAVAVMLAVAIRRSHAVSAGMTLAGLGASLAACVAVGIGAAPVAVAHLLLVDSYGAFFMALSAGGAMAAAMLAHRGLARGAGLEDPPTSRGEEFYILLLAAALGAQVLACGVHFASFFLGLELLTIPLYGLIAYRRHSSAAIAAAIKYLVLASVATSLLLLGLAMIYAETGTMRLDELAAAARAYSASATASASAATSAGKAGATILVLAGVALVLVGIAFKLALVPLHFWAPDVYQGAAPAVGGLLATVSKGAVFGLLLRCSVSLDLAAHRQAWTLVWIVAAATMSVGNLLAIRQRNIKRLLGCSSIANAGYLLAGLLAGGATGAQAATFYLVAYFAATLAAFGVVGAVTGTGGLMQDLDDYRGLAWRRGGLAGVLTVAMLSLAGMPLTAGFMAKFYIVLAGVGEGLWVLVIVLLANSVLSLFYYLRVVVAVYAAPAESHAPAGAVRESPEPAAAVRPAGILAAVAVTVLLAATIYLGVLPGPATAVIRSAVASLF